MCKVSWRMFLLVITTVILLTLLKGTILAEPIRIRNPSKLAARAAKQRLKAADAFEEITLSGKWKQLSEAEKDDLIDKLVAGHNAQIVGIKEKIKKSK